MRASISPAKLSFKHGSIGFPDAERDERPHIAKHRFAQIFAQLSQILMRERQGKTIFSSFRKDAGKGIGRAVVKFIDIQKKRFSFFRGAIGAGKGCKLKTSDEERTQKAAMGFAYQALAQIGNEDASAIHHEAETNFCADLAQHMPQRRREKQLPHFVLDRGNHFLKKSPVIPFKFVDPERKNRRVLDLADNPSAIPFIVEHSGHPEEACVLALKQRRKRGKQYVFEPRSPGISPNLPERRDDPGSNKVPVVPNGTKKIQSQRITSGGIEIYYIIGSPRWNMVKKLLCQVAMRVDEPDPATGFDILENQIAKKCGLTRACLPDDIDMLPALGRVHTEAAFTAPLLAKSHENCFIVRFHPDEPLLNGRRAPATCAYFFITHRGLMTTNAFYEPPW